MEPINKTLRDPASSSTGQSTPVPKMPDERLTAAQKSELLRQNLRLSSGENTFANFKKLRGTEKAFNAFSALADGKAAYAMLLCYGGVGNGKTYFCEATALRLHERGIFCRVLNWAEVVRAMKRAMSDESPISPEVLVDKYCEAKYLIIDDVGAGMSGSEYSMKQLEEIIDTRYRDRLFTIITTNRDIRELPERIISRFRDKSISCMVLNEGTDYRPQKQ